MPDRSAIRLVYYRAVHFDNGIEGNGLKLGPAPEGSIGQLNVPGVLNIVSRSFQWRFGPCRYAVSIGMRIPPEGIDAIPVL